MPHIIEIIITENDCGFLIKVGPEKISHNPEKIIRSLHEICWPYAEYVTPFRNSSVKQT
jgi:hypothetical protein